MHFGRRAGRLVSGMNIDADPNVLRAGRPLARTTRLLAALAVLSLLASCGPVTLTLDGPRDEVRIGAEASAGILVVRVPETRPRETLEVRRPGGRSFRIPAGHFPPPGQCRIWRPDTPPGRQDPPGDCDELERRVPAGAYLVVG